MKDNVLTEEQANNLKKTELTSNTSFKVIKSLLNAVLKTSPLPLPEDKAVFTRQIYFNFGTNE